MTTELLQEPTIIVPATNPGRDGRVPLRCSGEPEAHTRPARHLLHLLGFDPANLTYRYAGRDSRLIDVYGNVGHELIT